ncbi:YkoP family protein [Brevibacillus choshinensis]|uniref:YkoP family protein n=1 Tax=Brevibacillus choshinensis TaxID=54911 RepID=UPI003D18E74D
MTIINRRKRLRWERVFRTLFQIKPVGESDPILHMRVCTYRGKSIRFKDGEEIRKGDCVSEIHFDNEWLYKPGSNSRSSVQLAIQMIRQTNARSPK